MDGDDRADLPDIPDEFVRSALEFALGIAIAGTRLRPPLPAPAALRPYLKLTRLPPAALAPVRRAVHTDVAFRQRILPVATEDLIGRPGWLWLHRPAGWADELRALHAAAEAEAEAEAEARAGRAAARRLEHAERAAQEATIAAGAARAEAAAERARREAAEAEARRRAERIEQLEREVANLRRRVARAEDAAAAATQAQQDAEAARAAAEADRDGERASRVAAEERLQSLLDAGAAAPPVPAGPVAGTAEVAAALRDAAEALARAAAVLAGTPAEAPAPAPGALPPVMAPVVPRRPGTRPRRRPVPLPPGLLADTPAAAEHLVRVPGVQLLVDGYNVAKSGWPGLPLAAQRRRLIDALEELGARTGCVSFVVFDGTADQGAPTGGRAVRVSFTAAGVPADDVIIDLAAGVPLERPVVVVSSDNDVRRRAAAVGAAVLSSAQLLSTFER